MLKQISNRISSKTIISYSQNRISKRFYNKPATGISADSNWTKGKVIIVTGGSNGIGKATALCFGKAGANVVVSDVSVEQGKKVAKEIQDFGNSKAIFVKCDVSKSKEVQELVKATVSEFGRLDFAFNNAGIEGMQGDCCECTEENFDRVISTNLKGTFLCMKYEIPEMLKVGGGSIVNTASIAGVVGFPGIVAYDCSKHGLLGLTKTVSLEYAKRNIRVNAVCPGVIRTPMIDRFTKGSKEAEAAFVAGEPIGRLGTPDEVAGSVFWLCSPSASFVTGHPLVVDGGWVAQ